METQGQWERWRWTHNQKEGREMRESEREGIRKEEKGRKETQWKYGEQREEEREKCRDTDKGRQR